MSIRATFDPNNDGKKEEHLLRTMSMTSVVDKLSHQLVLGDVTHDAMVLINV